MREDRSCLLSFLTFSPFFVFLALAYNAINSTIDGVRGKHDAFGSMAAGGLTGALYKSTGVFSSFSWISIQRLRHVLIIAGVRPAFAAATIMTGLAGVWSYVKKAV